MTDDSIPKKAPQPVQRLDGPEALLTAEWNVAHLPWLTPDETPDATPPQPSPSAVPPAPPSQRLGRSAAFTAGAGALPAATRAPAPLITRPKQRQPELEIQPSVLIATDLGATLPPRAEREAAACPSGERNAEFTTPSRGRPSFVALGAVIGCVFGTAVWTVVLSPPVADAAPESGLPHFLRDAPATAGVSAQAPPPSTLPPSLAATLAQALPLATAQAASAASDAGAPAAPPVLEETPRPSTEPVSAETHRRAAALRAALQAEHTTPPATSPDPSPTTRVPPVAHRSSPTRPTLLEQATASAVKSPSADSTPRSEARAAGPRTSPAIRPLTTYTYEDKALFAVATAPMRVTDLVLERGETLAAQPTAGDASRWVISVVQNDTQSHVFVKPLRPGLRTNLTLTTNRRSYFLELSSSEDGTYMAGVEWQYPGDELARRREAVAQAERERQSTTAVSDLQALRFDYRIAVTAGAPSWKPTMVFDDGQKTFIRFARPVSSVTAPLLFVLRAGSTKDAKFVNYRVKNNLYVVDRLFESAELRLAQPGASVDVVRITRKQP